MVYEGYNLHYPISNNVYKFVSSFVEYNLLIKNRKLLISNCKAKKEYFIKKLSDVFKIMYLTPEFVFDKSDVQIILLATPASESAYINSILAISVIEKKNVKQTLVDNNILIDECSTQSKYIVTKHKLPNLYSICLQYVKTQDIDKFIEILKQCV
jgi:hypothetical protein